MLTIITGPDAYLARTSVRRIRDSFDPDGLSTSVFDARADSLEEIFAALRTPGFFGAGRLIVVHDLIASAARSTPSDEDAPNRSKAKATVDWAGLFESVQAENRAVLVELEFTAVPTVVAKRLPRGSEIVSSEPPRGAALTAWIKERAVAAGSAISDTNARLLADLLSPGGWMAKAANPAFDRPPRLELFANEIEKLALFAGPNTIEREQIRLLTAPSVADRRFTLLDALIGGDRTRVLRELDATAKGDDEAARLLIQIAQEAELLAAAEAAGHRDPQDAGRMLGLSNPARMSVIMRTLRSARARPARLVEEALTVDRQLKSGQLRRIEDQLHATVDRFVDAAQESRLVAL